MKGIFYAVSTGTGDPELMTLKAVRIIRECPCIAAVSSGGKMTALSIAEKAADITDKTVIPLDMPMTSDREKLSAAWDTAAKTIAGHLDSGEDTAMLTLGDVSVYSTAAYIAEKLSAMGYECRMCAGVTAFCSSAAACGIPLVTGDEPLMVIPAQCSDEEISSFLRQRGTKVIMKGGDMQRISRLIHENAPDAKIYTAENCGFENEHLNRDIPEKCGYFTTVIIR